jgi:hypothetical protein
MGCWGQAEGEVGEYLSGGRGMELGLLVSKSGEMALESRVTLAWRSLYYSDDERRRYNSLGTVID